MADMLEWGEKYLRDKRLEFMSTDVVYIMSEGTTFVGSGYEGVFSDQSFLHTTARTAAKCEGPLRSSSLTILREKIKEVKKNRKRVCII